MKDLDKLTNDEIFVEGLLGDGLPDLSEEIEKIQSGTESNDFQDFGIGNEQEEEEED